MFFKRSSEDLSRGLEVTELWLTPEQFQMFLRMLGHRQM